MIRHGPKPATAAGIEPAQVQNELSAPPDLSWLVSP
jgi:hypothetical protein